MTPPARNSLVSALTAHALDVAQDCASPKEHAMFYEMVDRVLMLPSHEEVNIWADVDALLVNAGEHAAAAWLLQELSDLAVLQSCANGPDEPEQSSVLFAIPVVMGAEDSVTLGGAPSCVADMQSLLLEAMVVDPRARVGLVTRVLSTVDLMSKSPGELRRLNRDLAEQLLANASVLRLPDYFDAETPHGANMMEGVRLHYLVGVAVIADGYTEQVFPALDGESREHGPSLLSHQFLPAAGFLESRESWEDAFIRVFDVAFAAVDGALTVVAPQGLYDDLKTGAEAARDVAFSQGIEACVAPEARKYVHARILPFLEEGRLGGYSVEFAWGTLDDSLPAWTWPALPHEAPADALAQLRLWLADKQIAETPVEGAGWPASPASYLLH